MDLNKNSSFLKHFICTFTLSFVFFFIACSKSQKNIELDVASTEVSVSEKTLEDLPELSLEEQYPHIVKKNVALYTYLRSLDVPSIDIIEMDKAAKPVKRFSSLRPGMRFKIETDELKNLLSAEFRFSAVERLRLNKIEEAWSAELVREDIDVKTVSFTGHVETTLWESAQFSEMDPYLIFEMAEIFGWEIDFSRQVRKGDSWRLTAEKKFVKGEHVGWGKILASEYINQGEKYSAILFRDGDEDKGYFDSEANNLRKMFLKSPLKFGRVTSRFNKRRFHPKLRRIRPHNGVDYGVPRGTPVRSVANGVVTFRGRRGGGGNVLKISHNATYKTAYKHLSRFGKGIRNGVRVKQGQIVAYTGNTGLSTGPHLHYELLKNGRYVDSLRIKFPSAKPLAQNEKLKFLEQAKRFTNLLPKWNHERLRAETGKTWSEYVQDSLKEKLNFDQKKEDFVYQRFNNKDDFLDF